MEQLKVVVIINPKSGTHDKKRLVAVINRYFQKHDISYEIVMTEYPGHAEHIAAGYANKVDRIIVIGGDGTVNEVGRALIGSDTAMAIVPFGSGNGLARDLQIPMRVTAALHTAIAGDIKLIDHGLINGRPFFCTCGTGFDASVSMKFANAHRRGFITYMEKTLTEWLNYEPVLYTLTVDDRPPMQCKAFLIACANAAQYGNNAYIAPQANIDDGMMNVTIVEPFSIIDIPGLVVQLFTKTIDKNSNIKTFSCKKLHISSQTPNPAHYDGDPIMLDNDIDVEIVQNKLYVVVPNKEDLNNIFKYTLSQRYNRIVNDIQNSTEYLDDINNKFGKRISDKNREVLDFIKKTNDDILNKIQNLISKK